MGCIIRPIPTYAAPFPHMVSPQSYPKKPTMTPSFQAAAPSFSGQGVPGRLAHQPRCSHGSHLARASSCMANGNPLTFPGHVSSFFEKGFLRCQSSNFASTTLLDYWLLSSSQGYQRQGPSGLGHINSFNLKSANRIPTPYLEDASNLSALTGHGTRRLWNW